MIFNFHKISSVFTKLGYDSRELLKNLDRIPEDLVPSVMAVVAKTITKLHFKAVEKLAEDILLIFQHDCSAPIGTSAVLDVLIPWLRKHGIEVSYDV